MTSRGPFEIFRKASNAEPVWVEASETLDGAMHRAREMASAQSGDYFVFDRQNQKFIDASATAGIKTNTRVLVADDHEAVRKGVCSMLSGSKDFEVVGEACNGKEAVEMARKLEPDLIIMDFSMPLMDGLTAAQIITLRRPKTAVLMFSMHDRNDYVDIARRHGIDGYVSKSDGSAILDALETVRNGDTCFPAKSYLKILGNLS